jgi:hypothetical protein
MTTEQDKLARARMAEPFVPMGNISNETRDSRSLEYIAFYLGEIEKHLGKIAGQLDSSSSNGVRIATELQGIQRVLQSKT